AASTPVDVALAVAQIVPSSAAGSVKADSAVCVSTSATSRSTTLSNIQTKNTSNWLRTQVSDASNNVMTIASGHACQFCGKTFPWPSKLNEHMRTHTGERPFQCPHCVYRATQRITLKKHIFAVHPSLP
ncbi:Zinc finger C2H2-type, partial [Trinorchestia longiramus]